MAKHAWFRHLRILTGQVRYAREQNAHLLPRHNPAEGQFIESIHGSASAYRCKGTERRIRPIRRHVAMMQIRALFEWMVRKSSSVVEMKYTRNG